MDELDLTRALAAERAADLLWAAEESRLRRLARCCRPAAWRRAARRGARWLEALRTTRATDQACSTC